MAFLKQNWFKIFIIFLGLIFFTPQAHALECYQVDGMSIFGYKYDEYIFIGAIANEYDSDSIANEYGWGSEYKSNSIMNEYGSFGGEYGSYSAFNEYASKPPIIINRDYEFVGYLTVNEYKSPSINTYVAIACAKKSYTSSISDHEDITFKNIPGGGSSYSGSGSSYSPPAYTAPASSCPTNSSMVNGTCTCNSGYTANTAKNACITLTESCQNKYGTNTYGKDSLCYCIDGYQWNTEKTYCYIQLTPPPTPVFTSTPRTIPISTTNINPIFTPAELPALPTCKEGQALTLDKKRCINIPENSYPADNGKDIWLCNDGFREQGDSCALIRDEINPVAGDESVVTDNANETESIFIKLIRVFKFWEWFK